MELSVVPMAGQMEESFQDFSSCMFRGRLIGTRLPRPEVRSRPSHPILSIGIPFYGVCFDTICNVDRIDGVVIVVAKVLVCYTTVSLFFERVRDRRASRKRAPEWWVLYGSAREWGTSGLGKPETKSDEKPSALDWWLGADDRPDFDLVLDRPMEQL